MTQKRNRGICKGISLVEILLYMGIFSIFLLTLFNITFEIFHEHDHIDMSVSGQSDEISLLEIIKNEIYEGGIVISPDINQSTTTLRILSSNGTDFTANPDITGYYWKTNLNNYIFRIIYPLEFVNTSSSLDIMSSDTLKMSISL
jgi:hypothetical protein